MTLDDTILEAIALKRQVKNDDLAMVYAKMQETVERISYELDVTTLLPGGPSPELGLAAKRKDAKDLYAIFKKRIGANLCAKDGHFAELIRADIQGSTGAVVTALAATLSVPAAALPILVPLAVIITHSGLEAFCESIGD